MTAPIQAWLDQRVDRELARPSRVHRLPALEHRQVFVKREDELSCGISGSKLRKYASLLPFIMGQGISEVALIGGPHSNNLVGLLQIFKERGIDPWLFVREAGDAELKGNALIINMLLARPEQLIRIKRTRWSEAPAIAQAFLDERRRQGAKTLLVPEGAALFESLPGAMTLAADLLRNEAELGRPFRHVFLDSGTGMGAIGLLLGLALMDVNPSDRLVHLTLIAGDERDFLRTLRTFEARLRDALPSERFTLPQIVFHHPPYARAFGSVTKRLFEDTRRIAQEEGILMDPTYSVKHYLSMRSALASIPASESALFIFTGSALGLVGFQDRLADAAATAAI